MYREVKSNMLIFLKVFPQTDQPIYEMKSFYAKILAASKHPRSYHKSNYTTTISIHERRHQLR